MPGPGAFAIGDVGDGPTLSGCKSRLLLLEDTLHLQHRDGLDAGITAWDSLAWVMQGAGQMNTMVPSGFNIPGSV